ncbi:MAG TPA: OmpH family outer membrane protein [Pseudomonadales bacterium]
MKRFICAAALLVCSTMAMASGKIAVVNLQQAVLNTDFAQARIAELENDASFKSNLEQARKIQDEGRKLAEQYQKELPTMAASQKQDMEKQIREKQADLEHIAGKLQTARDGLLEGVMQELNVSATRAIRELIETEGIGLLLNANPQLVLHADTSYDISAKLTDRLNRLHNDKNKK